MLCNVYKLLCIIILLCITNIDFFFQEGNANLDKISMKLSKYVEYMRYDNPLLSYGLAIGANDLQKQKGGQINSKN